MRKFSILIITGLLVTSCSGGMKEGLGLTKVSPDEYTVISNPPLSMPPDFKLRAPEDEAVTFKTLTSGKGQNILQDSNYEGYKNNNESKYSAAEDNLLKSAGIDGAKPNIRQQIHDDNKVINKKEEESTFGKFYYHYLKNKQDPALDPDEEKKRLESLEN